MVERYTSHRRRLFDTLHLYKGSLFANSQQPVCLHIYSFLSRTGPTRWALGAAAAFFLNATVCRAQADFPAMEFVIPLYIAPLFDNGTSGEFVAVRKQAFGRTGHWRDESGRGWLE